MAQIIVLGAGLNGLSTAMLLARDGHEVTVVERDPAGPVPAVEAWDTWDRRGVNQFVLNFQKDGSGGLVGITTSTSRVPATLQETPLAAPPADIGVLANWDIVGALDAGPPAGPPAPYPKIYRGERCAYLIHLVVTDTTPRGDGGPVHAAEHYFPFCIMNDIPDKVPFPVP